MNEMPNSAEMTILRQFLIDGAERKYRAAVQLTDIDSKNDPVSEPYRSLYRAREIWQSLKTRIEACTKDFPPLNNALHLRSDEKDPKLDNHENGLANGQNSFSEMEVVWMVLSAVVELKLGMNYSETEEKASGEEQLKKCLDRLDGIKFDPRACNVCQVVKYYHCIVLVALPVRLTCVEFDVFRP